LCSCYVHIVGLVEGITKGNIAAQELDIEGCTWRTSALVKGEGIARGLHASVVDESIDAPWVSFYLLESLLNRVIAGKIDLDQLNGIA